MARDKTKVRVGLRVPGLYEQIRSKQLATALAPDPRLYMIADPDERERVVAAAPTYAPTALGQTEALLARESVRVPRWMLAGWARSAVRDWPVFADRRVEWFMVGPDDEVSPCSSPLVNPVRDR